jgi:hypothetical protein
LYLSLGHHPRCGINLQEGHHLPLAVCSGRQCSALLCHFLLPRSLLASTLFVGNVACAFIGLRVVDVPMFLCVRRVTTVCVLVTEYIMLKKVRNRR